MLVVHAYSLIGTNQTCGDDEHSIAFFINLLGPSSFMLLKYAYRIISVVAVSAEISV